MTPGKFIISPIPKAQGSSIRASMSVSEREAPAVSMDVAGTQDGTMTKTTRGLPAAARTIHWMPCTPMTLAISWGSITTAVVPWLTTALAY